MIHISLSLKGLSSSMTRQGNRTEVTGPQGERFIKERYKRASLFLNFLHSNFNISESVLIVDF